MLIVSTQIGSAGEKTRVCAKKMESHLYPGSGSRCRFLQPFFMYKLSIMFHKIQAHGTRDDWKARKCEKERSQEKKGFCCRERRTKRMDEGVI